MGNVVAAENVHISGMYSVHIHVCMCTVSTYHMCTCVYILYVYMCVHIILHVYMCVQVHSFDNHYSYSVQWILPPFPESSWTNIAA